MIKNIIFDWAGVICNSTRNIYDVAMIIFDYHNVKRITLDEFRETWDQPYIEFYKKFIPNITLKEEQSIFAREIVKCPQAMPYSGIVEMVKDVHKAGKKIVVYSSDIKETIFEEIKRFGLSEYFQEIDYDVHDKFKLIEEILKRNNFNPPETAIVGDTKHEIEVGKKFNLITVAVSWGYTSESRLQKANPNHIFNKVGDLKKLLIS